MNQVVQLRVEELRVDPNQPRRTKDYQAVEDLKLSIAANGIINPIEVDKDGVIVTGESRYTAAMELGMPTVPCRVIESEGSARLSRQVAENVVRAEMSPYDVGLLFQDLKNKTGKTNKQLGDEFGLSEGYVKGRVALANYAADVTALVRDGSMDMKTAQFVEAEDDREIRDYLVRKVSEKRMRNNYLVRCCRNFLRMTHDFDRADEILGADTSYKFQAQLFDDEMPSPSKAIAKNLAPGQRVIRSMSELAVVLDGVDLEDVAPLHLGRLLTTYTLLKQKFEKLDKQLTLQAGADDNGHRRIQDPARR